MPATDHRRPRRPAWIAPALRLGVPLLVVALLAVVRPAIVTGTINSPRALAIVAGVVAATVGWSALLRRFLSPAWLRTVLVWAPVAVFLGWFVGPYFMADQVVDEALPGAVTATDPAPSPESGDAATATTAMPTTGGGEDASAVVAGQQAGTTDDQEGAGTAPAADAGAVGAAADPPATTDLQTEEQESPPPGGPVELTRGTFVGLDDHRATGQAAIYRLADGSRIVRLEEVDLQRVPDPYVYLVPGADQTAPTAEAVNLGPLTGNVGSSNYPIPAEIVLDGPVTVLVWCEPFASPVGAATQTPS